MNVLRRPLDGARLLLAVLLVLPVLLVSFGTTGQWLFGVVAMVGAYAFKRSRSDRSLFALGLLAILVSSRYLIWRTSHTLWFHNVPSALLGAGLYFAEVYAWIVLLLGFLQTSRPLERPVIEVLGDPADWPTVDIYVPSYNESLDIVRTTVFAAMDLDYPAHRFQIYILDDGRRDAFRQFADEVGVGYIVRDNNLHAKAGNLNAALGKTRGELIAIFDCDHVPTRAFLQLTVGWFQRDRRLALVQTPHHMYSPDPVQRNVTKVERMSGEGDLFYGPVQGGNDLWNATFFCGSCAVIRREALMETNGFAGETVTEDAHTALKLQRTGWNTAYVDARLSAGLATERLVLHVGQRIRWARGMTQIMRLDNPLLGRGLKWQQRLCYINAMLHFQFPLPRIVFLTSPLAFLLFDQNVIAAPTPLIFAYAAPHLVCATFLAARTQKGARRPFWGEIYETILAFHLVPASVWTWFQPRKGKFNVTDKGSLLKTPYVDWHIVRPHIICVGVLTAGMAVGIARQLHRGGNPDALILNLGWAGFSLAILLAAIAVARESRQVRSDTRFEQATPGAAWLESGHCVAMNTVDLSLGGASLEVPGVTTAELRTLTHVSFDVGDATLVLEVQVRRAHSGRAMVHFVKPDALAQRYLVRLVMGRADAWQPAAPIPAIGMLKSVADIAKIDLIGMKTVIFGALDRWRPGGRAAASAIAATILVLVSHPAHAGRGGHAAAHVADFSWAAHAIDLNWPALPLGVMAILAAGLLSGPVREHFETQARARLACLGSEVSQDRLK